jgi:hypothetical protein
MEEIMAEQSYQLSGCTSDVCVVEVGRLLGAQYVAAGSVRKSGTVYTVNTRLFNVETGAVAAASVKDCSRCRVEDLLTRTLAIAARELAGLGDDEAAAETRPGDSDLPQQTQAEAVDPALFGQRKGTATALFLLQIAVVVFAVWFSLGG